MVEHGRGSGYSLRCRLSAGPVTNWLLLKAGLGDLDRTPRSWHHPRGPCWSGQANARFASEGGNLMGIIWTLIIGLLAGIVAKLLMPGRDPGGFIITMLLGVAGAFVATYLGQAVGWYQANQGAGFIGAVVGAIILLVIYRMVKR
jgi:uncharacterized membrane protein YeaQ/YmgE (transglycosylase-associated protein family)